eukprot:symbB.v1.2.040352.t1/scaffold7165.1/size12945/2
MKEAGTMFNGYAWAYHELECLDGTCGYNASPDTPPGGRLGKTACAVLQKCASGGAGGSYSCGAQGPALPAYDLTKLADDCTKAKTGKNWWGTNPGCKKSGALQRPARKDDLDQRLTVVFQKLSPWLTQQDVDATKLDSYSKETKFDDITECNATDNDKCGDIRISKNKYVCIEVPMIPCSRPSACPPWPPPEPLHQHGAVSSTSSPWSQILFNLVGDLLRYSGANEVNMQLSIVRSACREVREQIDEECLTFNYDDNCGLGTGPSRDRDEIVLLNNWIKRHPRLKFFECMIRNAAKFRVMLEELKLPMNTRCSFVFEFKVNSTEMDQLLRRFCVRKLSVMPEEEKDTQGGYPTQRPVWQVTPSLQVLCLRSCSEDIVKSFFSVSPRLRRLQLVDSKIQSIPSNIAENLTSLSLTGITNLPDEQVSKLLMSCQNLRSLYIAKCHISHISFSLPQLELLSVTHCRQLTDQCATEILSPANNPSLRFVDLSECRSLTAPTVEHPELEIAWLMHCPQLTGQAVSAMFKACTSLTAVNLA